MCFLRIPAGVVKTHSINVNSRYFLCDVGGILLLSPKRFEKSIETKIIEKNKALYFAISMELASINDFQVDQEFKLTERDTVLESDPYDTELSFFNKGSTTPEFIKTCMSALKAKTSILQLECAVIDYRDKHNIID